MGLVDSGLWALGEFLGCLAGIPALASWLTVKPSKADVSKLPLLTKSVKALPHPCGNQRYRL